MRNVFVPFAAFVTQPFAIYEHFLYFGVFTMGKKQKRFDKSKLQSQIANDVEALLRNALGSARVTSYQPGGESGNLMGCAAWAIAGSAIGWAQLILPRDQAQDLYKVKWKARDLAHVICEPICASSARWVSANHPESLEANLPGSNGLTFADLAFAGNDFTERLESLVEFYKAVAHLPKKERKQLVLKVINTIRAREIAKRDHEREGVSRRLVNVKKKIKEWMMK